MRVGLLGINHKLANLDLRESLAKACHRRFSFGGSAHEDHIFVVLSTCNRTEVYFTSSNLAETHTYLLQLLRHEINEQFDQKVYSYFGQDCFLHLARVAAGLDSAIIAETEIQGQVKAAYEQAIGSVKLPSELHYLFQKALRIGKKVRSTIALGRGIPDLEHAIFNTGMHLFNSKQEDQAKILFIGASDVNRKILAFLKAKGLDDITICNRSLQKALRISEEQNLSVLEWRHLDQWHHFNWIILGTKAPHHLIKRTDLPEQCKSHKLIMDLCVPRNVEPHLGRDSRITLLNIDQINRILRVRKQQMSHTIGKAEQFVSLAAKQYIESFQHKSHKAICSQ